MIDRKLLQHWLKYLLKCYGSYEKFTEEVLWCEMFNDILIMTLN